MISRESLNYNIEKVKMWQSVIQQNSVETLHQQWLVVGEI